jgi:hypothetical protein
LFSNRVAAAVDADHPNLLRNCDFHTTGRICVVRNEM